jgi:hypothetical protein
MTAWCLCAMFCVPCPLKQISSRPTRVITINLIGNVKIRVSQVKFMFHECCIALVPVLCFSDVPDHFAHHEGISVRKEKWPTVTSVQRHDFADPGFPSGR